MSPWFETYLTPSRQSVQFATKATLAMLLALYVALWFDLERPYWALISAAFLQIRPMSGMVVEKGISQITGTGVGCVAGIAIMAAFVQAPIPALATLALWLALCTYASSVLRSNASYGCIMAGVTAMLVVIIGASRPDALFSIAVARLSELALGAACATLVSSLLWPIKVRDHLIRQADLVVNQAFLHASQRLLPNTDDATLQSSLTRSLEPLTQLETDSQAARYEGPEGPGRVRASHVLTRHTLRMMATLHALQQLLEHQQQRLSPALGQLHRDLSSEFSQELSAGLAAAASDKGVAPARERLQTLRQRALACPEDGISPLELRILLGLREVLSHALVMLDARDAIEDPGSKRLREAPLAWHRDHLAAGLNGLRSGIIFATLAAFWLATGWANGQVAMLMGALGSAFFASRDDPATAGLNFAKGMLASVPSALLFGHILLAQASGFGMLAMLFLPPLFIGLLGATNPRLIGYCLAFTIGNILLTMPGNAMDFSFDSFINRALAVLIGLGVVVAGFRMIPGFGPKLRKRRLVNAITNDLRDLPGLRIAEAERRFIGGMVDRLLHLARHDDMLPQDQRHLFALGLTGLDLGYACLRLRRQLDGLPGEALAQAGPAFFTALAQAFADSAQGRSPSEVQRLGKALIEALNDSEALDVRRRAIFAGLVERLSLSLERQAQRFRDSHSASMDTRQEAI